MPSSDEQRRPSRNTDETRLREEAIAWVVRLRNSSLTEHDRRAFESWKSRSPAHARAYQHASAIWEDPDLRAAAHQSALGSPPLSVAKETAWSRHRIRYAAAIAACVIAFTLVGAYFDMVTWVQADYRTSVGEQRILTLPDQSRVTLNTQSAIAVSFDAAARHVRLLKGEALFMVQSDAARPFIVESPHIAIRTVGTEFIVRAGEKRDRVTVLEGTVDVHNRGNKDAVSRVTAGLQIHGEPGELSQPAAVDLPTASAWLQGRLVVNGAPLEEVLDEIERYYPGTIALWNQDLRETQVTGTFNLYEPAQSLALLVKTFPLTMVRLTDLVVILV